MTAKILYMDIETTDVLMRKWDVYREGAPNQIVEDWKLLGFCYAWNDGPVQKVYPPKEMREVPGYYRDWEIHAVLVMWDLFDEADVIIAHNGDRFDIIKMNAKFAEYHLGAPAPSLSIDTKKVASRYFKFSRNNLGELGMLFGFGDKMHHTGYDMWVGCMQGRRSEWNRMERYNVKDVILLRKVYKHMAPFMKNHPSLLDNEDPELACTTCGSKKFQKRGFHRTPSGIHYQRYQCSNGHYFRSRKREQVGVKTEGSPT